MDAPKASPIPPQPRHEEERAHKKTEHEEEQPRATDEAGQVRANVSPLFCAPAESNPRSDGNRQAHEPGRASARGAASVSEPRSLFRSSLRPRTHARSRRMMISLLIPWFYRAFGRFVLEIRRQYYCTAFYRGSSRQIARRVAPRRLP